MTRLMAAASIHIRPRCSPDYNLAKAPTALGIKRELSPPLAKTLSFPSACICPSHKLLLFRFPRSMYGGLMSILITSMQRLPPHRGLSTTPFLKYSPESHCHWLTSHLISVLFCLFSESPISSHHKVRSIKTMTCLVQATFLVPAEERNQNSSPSPSH